jgi:hypothetical protein
MPLFTKSIFASFAFTIISLSALQAQDSIFLKGRILSDRGNPVTGSMVGLRGSSGDFRLRIKPDTLGYFSIRFSGTAGQYSIRAFAAGYAPYAGNIQLNSASNDAGTLVLKRIDSNILEQVTIVKDPNPVKLKGDTTEFNASAYKTNPDATAEDLVQKMPGVTTSNGQIQAQGENVKQVLVDGRPFFGDDPASVLRNLPAEVVDKIQVFDRRSDQSQATGFDDGNTSKTINIITRSQFRNGMFGKAYAGYGTDDRYKSGVVLNKFKGAQRITLLGSFNNINEQNFSAEDLMGVMSSGGGGGGMRGGMRGGMGRPGGSPGGMSSADNFLVDQRSGITQTGAFGLNYSNKFKKSELSASYFFNNSYNENTSTTNRYYVTGSENGLTYRESSRNNTINTNHRINLRWEYKPDTLHSLIVSPKASVQINKPNSSVTGLNSINLIGLSSNFNEYAANSTGYNASLGLLYRIGYKKKGRSLTFNITPALSGNKGNSSWNNGTLRIADSMVLSSADVKSEQMKSNLSMAANATYTEAAGKNGLLSISINATANQTNNEKRTSGRDTATELYNITDTLLSNDLKSRYNSAYTGLAYRWNKGKWSWNISLNAQWAELNNEQYFPVRPTVNRNFYSLLPGAMLMFKPSEKDGIRLFYRTANNAPSVDQLQEVVNNTNPLQLSTGNKNLKQDFQNNIFSRYSRVNAKKGTSLFVMLGGSFTRNYIGTSTFIANTDTMLSSGVFLQRGAQLSSPVNLNGMGSLRTFANYSFPVKKLKSNFNLNGGANYSRTPGIVNGAVNFANSISPNFGLVISSNISEKVDFTISSNTSYTTVSNSLQKALNSAYTNQMSKFRIQANPWKGLVLQTEVTHQLFNGLSTDLNNNFLIWNAGIGYKFLKKRAAELRLTAYDILRQNNSLSRNITETYYEDVQTNVLQRFFMLTFTYNLRAFGAPQQTPHTGGFPSGMPHAMPPRN